VQRQLGVTYKTAWRMCHLIRLYMGYVDGDYPMGGPGKTVEADETFIGGRDKAGKDDKAIVIGMIERGGDIVTRVVQARTKAHILPHIVRFVKEGSRVHTDEASNFKLLKEKYGYDHEAVDHSAKEYVRGDVHTNSIESFWSQVKRGINGTYVWVSKKHLQLYLREFEYRHNLRRQLALMFELLLQAFPKVRVE
jgi:transposase-like protein